MSAFQLSQKYVSKFLHMLCIHECSSQDLKFPVEYRIQMCPAPAVGLHITPRPSYCWIMQPFATKQELARTGWSKTWRQPSRLDLAYPLWIPKPWKWRTATRGLNKMKGWARVVIWDDIERRVRALNRVVSKCANPQCFGTLVCVFSCDICYMIVSN